MKAKKKGGTRYNEKEKNQIWFCTGTVFFLLLQ